MVNLNSLKAWQDVYENKVTRIIGRPDIMNERDIT
jgi:hypothetical protein